MFEDLCHPAPRLEPNDNTIKGGGWLRDNSYQHHLHYPQQHDQSLLEPPQHQRDGTAHQRSLNVHDDSSMEHQQSGHSLLFKELVEQSGS